MIDYEQQKRELIDELYHHGIKGQKWGIRRYRNEDGSLTPEGEKHYEDLDSKFYKNVMQVENEISKANLHNMKKGRSHDEDDFVSKSIRKKAIKRQREGEKYLKELFDSGYYTSGRFNFDPENTNYGSFMSAVENGAAKDFVNKNGRNVVISNYDSNGSEEYEQAIIDYTSKRM